MRKQTRNHKGGANQPEPAGKSHRPARPRHDPRSPADSDRLAPFGTAEQELRRLQSLAGIGFWDWDLASGASHWSDQLLQLLGCGEAGLEPRIEALLALLHPDDREQLRLVAASAIESNQPGRFELRAQRPIDGRERTMEVSLEAVPDATGAPARLVGTLRDITDHRRTMEALRVANAYNRSLIEAYPDPLVTIATTGRVTDANAAAVALFGRRRSDLIGSTFPDYFLDPDSARMAYRQAFWQSTVRDQPLELRDAQGAGTPVLCSATVYRDDLGSIVGVLATVRPVEESRRAEQEQLRASRGNRVVLNATGAGVIAFDVRGQCTFANPFAASLLGYRPNELVGRTLQGLVQQGGEGGDTPDSGAALEEAVRSGRYQHGSGLFMRRRDGQPFPVEYVANPIREGGWTAGAVVTFWDITDRRRAETALEQSEAKFRAIYHSNVIPIAFWEADGRISEANDAYLALIGYTREELKRGEVDWSALTPQEFRERDQWALDELASGKPLCTPYEKEYVRKDGLRVPLLIRSSKLPGREGGVAIAVDLSDRKRMEDALRTANAYNRGLIEASLDPMVIIGADGRIMDLNAATEAATGHRRQTLLGTDFADYFADPERARHGYRLAFREGRVTDYELDLLHREGGATPVLYNATVYRDESGHPVGVFAAARDISVRKRIEQELRNFNTKLEQRVAERTAQLEAAVRELEGISYTVSHDLRIPVRAIDGFSQLLVDGYAAALDEEGQRLLTVIRNNTDRMGRQIDGLLDFLRLGRAPINKRRVDVAAQVRETWAAAVASHPQRRIDLHVGNLPQALADPPMLRRVFANLLDNAIKFTRPAAAAQVEVGGEYRGQEVVYFVRDNGVGFDMRYADKLFGVAQHLHGLQEFEGTGIGLAIVHRIVTRHGGRVWAEGRVGEGATFYFSLPNGGFEENPAAPAANA